MASNETLPPFDKDYTFKHTAPPNPSFNYHDSVSTTEQGKIWVDGTKEGWQVFDTSKESPLCVVWFFSRMVKIYMEERLLTSDRMVLQTDLQVDDQRDRPTSHRIRFYSRRRWHCQPRAV